MFFLLLACSHGMHGSVDSAELDLSTTQTTDGGSWTVSWTSEPEVVPFNEPFTMQLRVEDPAGQVPETNPGLELDLVMPAHGHGMQVSPLLSELGPGSWEAEGLVLHMEGYWVVDVLLEAEQTEQASFDLLCCD